MNKAWLVSSFLVVGAIWVADHHFQSNDLNVRFLGGAEPVVTQDIELPTNHTDHVEVFNLHMPYEEAWNQAQQELCDQDGWHLGAGSGEWQEFNQHGKMSLLVTKGAVDSHLNFIAGTEGTDTYVEVRTQKP